MLRQLKAVKTFLAVCLVGAGLALGSQICLGAPGLTVIKPLPDKPVHVKHDKLELEVPVGAADQELTVQELDVNLEGIQVPEGFRVVSKMIRFGPHGMKFGKGKEIGLKIEIKLARAKLYYINRDKKKLEFVAGQEFNIKTRKLEAPLHHFSDYIIGISAGWDGQGIAPFGDYVTKNNVSIGTFNLDAIYKLPIAVFPGRGGMDLRLDYIFIMGYDRNGWFSTLDIPCLYTGIKETNDNINCNNTDKLYLPGGSFYAIHKSSKYYNYGGVSFYCDLEAENPYAILSDGTKIQKFTGYQVVTNPNGNTITYYYSSYGGLSKIIDSYGREIRITGNQFQQIIQQVTAKGLKTIQTITRTQNTEVFIDSLNRTTEFSFEYKCRGTDKYQTVNIIYPNKSKTSLEYYCTGGLGTSEGGRCDLTQKFYNPNQSNSRKIVKYQLTSKLASITEEDEGIANVDYRETIVDDGKISKKFNGYFTEEEHNKRTTYTPNWPYLVREYDSLSGKLIKSIFKSFSPTIAQYTREYEDDDGTYNKYFSYHYGQVETELTTIYNSDGTQGSNTSYNYQYDEWGNVTKVIDPNGTETRMAYANTSSLKNLAALGYQDSLYTSTGNGNVYNRMSTKATLVKDPVHNTPPQLKQTHYKYDSNGNLLQESEVYNGGYLHTYYTYDQYGNMLTKKDANGNTLGFEYSDKFKNAYLTRVYKPETNQTIATFDYDYDTGNKTMATDPKGNVFNYEYDEIGRLTQEYMAHSDSRVAIARKVTYDDTNSTVALKYGNMTVGYQEGFITYDPLFGKPTLLQRKVNGNWVTQKQFDYDTNGRLSWEKDGKGHTTNYAYDALDRKTLVTQPNGSTTQYIYDDRTVTTIDANGNKKVQKYDLLDRLASVAESPDQGTTEYTTSYIYDSFYDSSGDKPVYHLVKVVNPKNAATINTYDNLGRLIRTDYPQDGSNPMTAETFTYDNVGNLKTKTNGKGTKTLDYEFYAGYRLKTVTEPNSQLISYTYDANDNVRTQSKNGATYAYDYDARNRVTNLKAQLDGYTFNLGYDYDTFGRVKYITYPGRSSQVGYNYNDLDLLESIPGFVKDCTYYEDNLLKTMELTNGLTNGYEYDDNDRPTKITAGSLLNLVYDYDAVGNVKQINTDYYGYDGMNRLTWYGDMPKDQTTALTGKGTAWSYDAAGNMSSKSTYSMGFILGTTTSFNYDQANRLWSTTTYNKALLDVPGTVTNYSNDNVGARTGKSQADETWTYSYDSESRLTQVNKNNSTMVQCAYDGSGMRYKKVENGKTTYYIYSGPNPLVEYTPADGKYTYRIYAGKRAVAEEKAGVVKFYHKDHLGSTRVVTDASGNKVAEYKYAPYGEKELSNGQGSDYQFTDKANDESTGLSYFGARFYDSETGRFLTQDPKKARDNWFIYCGDNPVNRIDPDGQDYILLNMIDAAFGYGHNACLVGNDKDGWTYFSKDGQKEGSHKEYYPNLSDFQKSKTADKYDRAYRVSTTREQDKKGKAYGEKNYKKPYSIWEEKEKDKNKDGKPDVKKENCADLAAGVGKATGVDISQPKSGLGITAPNDQFKDFTDSNEGQSISPNDNNSDSNDQDEND